MDLSEGIGNILGGILLCLWFLIVRGFILYLFLVAPLIVVISSVGDSTQLQSYKAGECTIQAKQLIQEKKEVSSSYVPSTEVMTYRPEFRFLVHTGDDHNYRAKGYDYNLSSWDQSHGQAIVDQYTVGKTYPCWYDSSNPTRAVLTQQYNWLNRVAPLAYLVVLGPLLLFSFLRRMRR